MGCVGVRGVISVLGLLRDVRVCVLEIVGCVCEGGHLREHVTDSRCK